jgi:hypothetical protein
MKLIPLGVHGDGVPLAANMRDTLECISYNILTDKSVVRLMYTTFRNKSAGKITWDALFKKRSVCLEHETVDVLDISSNEREWIGMEAT